MKKRYENRASRLNKIDKMLDLPKEIYSNTPKISILGFDEMVIENYKGILEYEESSTKLE